RLQLDDLAVTLRGFDEPPQLFERACGPETERRRCQNLEGFLQLLRGGSEIAALEGFHLSIPQVSCPLARVGIDLLRTRFVDEKHGAREGEAAHQRPSIGEHAADTTSRLTPTATVRSRG